MARRNAARTTRIRGSVAAAIACAGGDGQPVLTPLSAPPARPDEGSDLCVLAAGLAALREYRVWAGPAGSLRRRLGIGPLKAESELRIVDLLDLRLTLDELRCVPNLEEIAAWQADVAAELSTPPCTPARHVAAAVLDPSGHNTGSSPGDPLVLTRLAPLLRWLPTLPWYSRIDVAARTVRRWPDELMSRFMPMERRLVDILFAADPHCDADHAAQSLAARPGQHHRFRLLRFNGSPDPSAVSPDLPIPDIHRVRAQLSALIGHLLWYDAIRLNQLGTKPDTKRTAEIAARSVPVIGTLGSRPVRLDRPDQLRATLRETISPWVECCVYSRSQAPPAFCLFLWGVEGDGSRVILAELHRAPDIGPGEVAELLPGIPPGFVWYRAA